MSNLIHKLNHDLTESELLTILEAARVAISDAEVFDYVADKMDLSDDEMLKLREKLQKNMG